jgi:hypothetical protein
MKDWGKLDNRKHGDILCLTNIRVVKPHDGTYVD